MFKIVKAVFAVFRAGQSVSNPSAWKNAQLVGTMLTALLALAAAFGYDLGLSETEIAGGAVFIVAAVNGILVVITSKKVGLPAEKANIDKVVDKLLAELNDTNRVQRVPGKSDPEKRNSFGFPTERNG